MPGSAPDERFTATRERLAALEVPVLFVVGEKDAIVPPAAIEYASKLVPNARFFQAPGCGHSVYFEDALTFNRVISDFFSEVGNRT